MVGGDLSHGAGLAAHHDGMRDRAAGDELHTLQHVAGGDAGRGEHGALAAHDVVNAQHLFAPVEAAVAQSLLFGLVARVKLRLHVAART